jgi:hypothetical protein
MTTTTYSSALPLEGAQELDISLPQLEDTLKVQNISFAFAMLYRRWSNFVY